MAGRQKNEGEDNRTAARVYNRATTAFAKSGRVAASAKQAAEALAGPEGRSLLAAERVGCQHAKEEDRLLRRGK